MHSDEQEPALTYRVPTEQQAPPSLRGRDRLHVPRPEQPALAVGQAHVHGYVPLPSVAGHHLTHKASALLDPVVSRDPNPRTRERLLGCHAGRSVSSAFSSTSTL